MAQTATAKLDELSSEWLGYKRTAFPKLCSFAGLSTLIRTVCSYLSQNILISVSSG